MGPSRGMLGRALVVAVILGMIAGLSTLGFGPVDAAAQSTPPTLTLSQTRGMVGRSITVTGAGFGAGEQVGVRWRSATSTPIATPQASGTGTFAVSIALPDAPNGAQTVFATGQQTSRQASAVYTVERPSGQSGRIGEGEYSTFATRIGLVGNTTSSGYVIRERDFFVALPACTPTNCPGGPYWGGMTNCGSRCYVKIVNPQSNACRVEPILDTGPWFRVDDWWNPTGQRYLNALASNPSDLPQGYTGASAARDGYNVGYGVGPSGIGYDDTGTGGSRPVRQVGNRAAIDLADGTWQALNLASDGVGAQVRVEMLWQTGGDPTAQAQACGHQINQTPTTNSPGTPNPSFSGTPLVPVASSQSSNGSGAAAVIDGNLQTSWRTTNANPTSGSFTIDYGQVRSLTGIRWNFDQFGYAERMVVETSVNGATWSGVGVYGNATAGQWRGIPISRQGRYVRFSFTNPGRDPRLGQVAEVEVWGSAGSTGTPTPTPAPIAGSNPQLSGSILPIVGSDQTPGSTSATRAYDRDPGTSWATSTIDIPGSATATFDLGRAQRLSGVRWTYRLAGGADRMRLQISTDGVNWTQLVTTSNRAPMTWEGWKTTASVRYVRFTFDNPNGVAVLGYLAEVEIWGTPSAATATPSPSVVPSPTPTVAVTPGPTTTPAAFGVVTNTGSARLNCRTTASTSGAIIAPIAGGTRLAIRGPVSNGWYPVVCANRNGWVIDDFFMPEATPTPTPRPSTPTPTVTPRPTTPNPTATLVTPAPDALGYIANSGGDRVNCRAQPSTAGTIITSLPEDTEVRLRGPLLGGWQPVVCANRDGYVFGQYIELRAPSVTPTPTASVMPQPGGVGYVANTGGARVNCRIQPSTSAAIITSLPEGTRVDLRGAAQGGWQPVLCANRDGHISAQYVSSTPETLVAPTATTTPIAPTATVSATATPSTLVPTATPGVTGSGYVANTGGNRINCRAEPSTSAAVITALAEGTMVELRGAPANGWQGVRCASADGYVSAQFISLDQPVPTPTALPATEEPAATRPPPEPTSPPAAIAGSGPQFGGSPQDITDVWGTNGGNNAWRSIDGSQETSWVSADGAGQAILTINLGSPQSLSGVRWMYLQSGGADAMRLQISDDGANWTQLVTTSNRAPYTWEGWYTDASAQYVRLVFDNPNGVATLGYVAEVQVWGTGGDEAGRTRDTALLTVLFAARASGDEPLNKRFRIFRRSRGSR